MSRHKSARHTTACQKAILGFIVFCSLLTLVVPGVAAEWYKGSTHAHSFWSDGDTLPELAIGWYKSHGYDFFTLSDHNVLMEGEKWIKCKREKKPATDKILAESRKRFGDDWVELRGEGDDREVRLKTFAELKKGMDDPGKFLLIQAEEITGNWIGPDVNDPGNKERKYQVHMNAINIKDLILPQEGTSVEDTIRRDLAEVRKQEKQSGRRILAHLNHPSWPYYDITARDMAAVEDLRFFELCNNAPDSHLHADGDHPDTEKLWDTANTIRLAVMKGPFLYGLATDDTHHYNKFGPEEANPGRGWIMVRSEQLATDPLLAAMDAGDFYASTGVTLKDYRYDPATKTISLEVDPEEGGNYVIEFIGTLAADVEGVKPEDWDKKKIGKVLKRVEGTKAEYKMTGKELFVRAVVRSDLSLPNPPNAEMSIVEKTAWMQPVRP